MACGARETLAFGICCCKHWRQAQSTDTPSPKSGKLPASFCFSYLITPGSSHTCSALAFKCLLCHGNLWRSKAEVLPWMSSACRISGSPEVKVGVRAALPNHGEVTVVLGDQGRQRPFGYNSSGLPSSWHSHKKTPPGAGTTSQGPRGRREREELGAVRGAPCPHSLELPPASSRQQCPQSASCVGRVRKLSLSCRTLPPPQLQAPSDLNGQSRAATAEAARCVRGGSGFTGTPCA